MKYTTCVRKHGSAMMLEVPPTMLEALHLSVGEAVGRVVDRGRLVVEPAHRARVTLDELLAKCDATAEISADCTWLHAAPIGSERL